MLRNPSSLLGETLDSSQEPISGSPDSIDVTHLFSETGTDVATRVAALSVRSGWRGRCTDGYVNLINSVDLEEEDRSIFIGWMAQPTPSAIQSQNSGLHLDSPQNEVTEAVLWACGGALDANLTLDACNSMAIAKTRADASKQVLTDAEKLLSASSATSHSNKDLSYLRQESSLAVQDLNAVSTTLPSGLSQSAPIVKLLPAVTTIITTSKPRVLPHSNPTTLIPHIDKRLWWYGLAHSKKWLSAFIVAALGILVIGFFEFPVDHKTGFHGGSHVGIILLVEALCLLTIAVDWALMAGAEAYIETRREFHADDSSTGGDNSDKTAATSSVPPPITTYQNLLHLSNEYPAQFSSPYKEVSIPLKTTKGYQLLPDPNAQVTESKDIFGQTVGSPRVYEARTQDSSQNGEKSSQGNKKILDSEDDEYLSRDNEESSGKRSRKKKSGKQPSSLSLSLLSPISEAELNEDEGITFTFGTKDNTSRSHSRFGDSSQTDPNNSLPASSTSVPLIPFAYTDKTSLKLHLRGWQIIRLVVLIACIVDMIQFAAHYYAEYGTFAQVHDLENTTAVAVRYLRWLRVILLLSRIRSLRTICMGYIATLKDSLQVISISMLMVCFFALLGYFYFNSSYHANPLASIPESFATIPSSLYYVLLAHIAPARVLPLLEPYYHGNPWMSVYHISFMFMLNIFMMNSLVAMSYRSYKAYMRNLYIGRSKRRKDAFKLAFHTLKRKVTVTPVVHTLHTMAIPALAPADAVNSLRQHAEAESKSREHENATTSSFSSTSTSPASPSESTDVALVSVPLNTALAHPVTQNQWTGDGVLLHTWIHLCRAITHYDYRVPVRITLEKAQNEEIFKNQEFLRDPGNPEFKEILADARIHVEHVPLYNELSEYGEDQSETGPFTSAHNSFLPSSSMSSSRAYTSGKSGYTTSSAPWFHKCCGGRDTHPAKLAKKMEPVDVVALTLFDLLKKTKVVTTTGAESADTVDDDGNIVIEYLDEQGFLEACLLLELARTEKDKSKDNQSKDAGKNENSQTTNSGALVSQTTTSTVQSTQQHVSPNPSDSGNSGNNGNSEQISSLSLAVNETSPRFDTEHISTAPTPSRVIASGEGFLSNIVPNALLFEANTVHGVCSDDVRFFASNEEQGTQLIVPMATGDAANQTAAQDTPSSFVSHPSATMAAAASMLAASAQGSMSAHGSLSRGLVAQQHQSLPPLPDTSSFATLRSPVAGLLSPAAPVPVLASALPASTASHAHLSFALPMSPTPGTFNSLGKERNQFDFHVQSPHPASVMSPTAGSSYFSSGLYTHPVSGNNAMSPQGTSIVAINDYNYDEYAETEKKRTCSCLYTFGSAIKSAMQTYFTTRVHLGCSCKKPKTSGAAKSVDKRQTLLVSELISAIPIIVSVFQMLNLVAYRNAHGADFDYNAYLETTWGIIGNCVFAFFVLEMLLKLWVFGWHGYKKKYMNLLDLGIVTGTLICLIISSVSVTTYYVILSLRVLRLLRIFMLLPKLNDILTTIAHVLPSLYNLIAVFLLIIFAWALGFEDLFGGKLNPDLNPRLNEPDCKEWMIYRSVMHFNDLQSSIMMSVHFATLAAWPHVVNPIRVALGTMKDGVFELANYGAVLVFACRILFVMVILPVFVGFTMESFNRNMAAVVNNQDRTTSAKKIRAKELYGDNQGRTLAEAKKEKENNTGKGDVPPPNSATPIPVSAALSPQALSPQALPLPPHLLAPPHAFAHAQWPSQAGAASPAPHAAVDQGNAAAATLATLAIAPVPAAPTGHTPIAPHLSPDQGLDLNSNVVYGTFALSHAPALSASASHVSDTSSHSNDASATNGLSIQYLTVNEKPVSRQASWNNLYALSQQLSTSAPSPVSILGSRSSVTTGVPIPAAVVGLRPSTSWSTLPTVPVSPVPDQNDAMNSGAGMPFANASGLPPLPFQNSNSNASMSNSNATGYGDQPAFRRMTTVNPVSGVRVGNVRRKAGMDRGNAIVIEKGATYSQTVLDVQDDDAAVLKKYVE